MRIIFGRRRVVDARYSWKPTAIRVATALCLEMLSGSKCGSRDCFFDLVVRATQADLPRL